MRFVLSLSSIVILAALLGGSVPTATADEAPPVSAVSAAPSTPAVVLSADELSDLAEREGQAPQLADFHGGGVTDVVAWTALGIGTAAFVMAIVLFCI
jgi:hypothetical protein